MAIESTHLCGNRSLFSAKFSLVLFLRQQLTGCFNCNSCTGCVIRPLFGSTYYCSFLFAYLNDMEFSSIQVELGHDDIYYENSLDKNIEAKISEILRMC